MCAAVSGRTRSEATRTLAIRTPRLIGGDDDDDDRRRAASRDKADAIFCSASGVSATGRCGVRAAHATARIIRIELCIEISSGAHEIECLGKGSKYDRLSYH